MNIPVMTRERALQIERAKADYIESWFCGMREETGNPFGVEVLHSGGVRAFAARNLKEIGLFNRVIGLGSQDEALLSEIVQYYREQEVDTYLIDINPYCASFDFLAQLASHGFEPYQFQTFVYGVPVFDPPVASAAVPIREVDPREIDLFADILVRGFQEALATVPNETRRLYQESIKVLSKVPGWHLYFATVDDVPSSIGMLYIQDGMASLAGGATLPEKRHWGCQSAMIRHRILTAAQAQCTLMMGHTEVGSTSQNNMERLGLRVAYTEVSWMHSVS